MALEEGVEVPPIDMRGDKGNRMKIPWNPGIHKHNTRRNITLLPP